jgi:hypothetical protein
MANVIYPIAKKRFLDGDIDLLADDIKVCLIDTDDYTYDAADDDLADVTSHTGAIVATSAALANKTTTGGQFNADDATFTSVSGHVSEALIIYDDTHASDALIAYLDTFESGMPVTPNGGNITVQWDASPEYIFAI